MPVAPVYVTPTDPNELVDLAVAKFTALTGRQPQPAEVEYLMINTMAYMMAIYMQAVQYAGEQGLISFATGINLDHLGEFLGVTRLAPAEAVTTLEFTLNPAHLGVTIPNGTRVRSTNQAIVFETVQDLNVTAGVTPASVSAQAQTAGEVGNGYAPGAITVIMDPIADVTGASNTTTSSGGTDAETDERLRARIRLAPAQFSTAGSVAAYEFHSLGANPDIIDVYVPTVPTVPGQVDIYILMEDGTAPSAAVLAQVEAAVNAENVRPLSDVVTVQGATIQNFSLNVDLTIYDSGDTNLAITAVTDALNTWTEGQRQRLGIDIMKSQLYDVVHSAYTDSEGNTLIYEVDFPAFSDIVVPATNYANMTSLVVAVIGTNPG